jgi:hypothetical protein
VAQQSEKINFKKPKRSQASPMSIKKEVSNKYSSNPRLLEAYLAKMILWSNALAYYIKKV